MKGCRALLTSEAILVEQTFTSTRDRCLFILGLAVGFRVSELLSIRVCDLHDGVKVMDRVFLARKNTKGKNHGRSAMLNNSAKKVIQELIAENELSNSDFLFSSRKGNGPLGRKQAWRILKGAFKDAGLEDKGLATHSLRKSYARNLYLASNKNLLLTQKGLGHSSLNSTSSYIATLDSELEELVVNMDMFKTG